MSAETQQDGAGAGERDTSNDEAILERARKRYRYAHDVEIENRKAAREDTEFVYVRGKQWPDDIRDSREQDDRPWLEINQLPQFVNQVVNDQRQGRPGVKVNPASGDASVEVAEVLEGLIRHIQYKSNGEAVYDTGFQYAVVGGRGYWRVCSDYVSQDSFDQELQIRRIADPDAALLDPDYQDPDGGDRGYGFVSEFFDRDTFERKWPKATALSWNEGDTDEQTTLWYDGTERIRVADYYERVYTPRTLVQMSDGAVGWADTLPKDIPPGVTVVSKRESEDCAVVWYKIAGGQQILEEYKWPGKTIPIICCMGDEIMIEGRRLFQGLIRRAKDSQTMYNYWQTSATELIALAPKSPWVAAEGQIEGYENQWNESNRRTIAVLPYKPTTVGGTPVPPPQRTAFAGVPTGIVEQANVCKQDLRATIGIYDPSLGQRSNEISGRAILAREKQGDTATFHFVDNLSRAIALTGRILVEAIPHFYDTKRMVATIGEDDEHDLVEINGQMVQFGPDGAAQVVKTMDLSTGQFAVVVDSGPGYETRRQEISDSMMQFVQAFPPAAAVSGDIIAKAMDWPEADQLAERLQMLLPPPVQQMIAQKKQAAQKGPDGSPMQVDPMQNPAVQQQMHQMQQALQQLTQENQQLKSGVVEKVHVAEIGAKAKAHESDVDAQVRMQQSAMAAQTAEHEAQARAASAERIANINAESARRVAEINAQAKLMLQGMMADSNLESVDPTKGPAGEEAPAMSEAILSLAQQIQQMTQVAMAPRHHSIQLDAQGNPVGSISQPVLQ